ncbi:DUF6314 family protein [Wielerella bovis]|uniref:DUF6314 family protein n=1 Tax=Wielerella bovis TaxID=2917790 RepID=UPI002019CAA8|nr:DUF6314 family protein [Wielerella bovis]ULJ65065.1 DUF6314 family protein [Wielerella bovis]ULJ67338.1 DUF6314 family protein [Wielerella bovis]
MMMTHDFYLFCQRINGLHFQAHSQTGSQMNWNTHGTGIVQIQMQPENTLDFNERITLANGYASTDRKRWQFLPEHMIFSRHRNGDYEALWTLVPHQDGVWRSESAYQCAPDAYSGELWRDGDALVFRLHIVGARKNEQIEYRYFQAASVSGSLKKYKGLL